MLADESVALNEAERGKLVREIQDEMLGLGPLEPLLADPTISDILVNTHSKVYVERRGKLELTDVAFADDAHLMKIIDKIVSRIGRRVDESSPMVDARLPDGSRVNAIIPPLAIDGPILSIRRFAVNPLHDARLPRRSRALTPRDGRRCSRAWSKAKVNLLISGGTGSGKTTLLNILSGYIPPRRAHRHDRGRGRTAAAAAARGAAGDAAAEHRGHGRGARSARWCATRCACGPDRIILGEVRGAEALDMLQAMNTGHEGSMTTIHANTPRDALTRLENMIGMAGMNLPPKASAAADQLGAVGRACRSRG